MGQAESSRTPQWKNKVLHTVEHTPSINGSPLLSGVDLMLSVILRLYTLKLCIHTFYYSVLYIVEDFGFNSLRFEGYPEYDFPSYICFTDEIACERLFNRHSVHVYTDKNHERRKTKHIQLNRKIYSTMR